MNENRAFDPDFTPGNVIYRPNETDDRRWLMLAVILNSALYLAAIFVAGLLTDHVIAWRLAIITFGTCYLAPLVQITSTGPLARIIATAIVAWSIVLGLAALVMLMI